ncbi:MAG: T9SS type A sorting domain-containing protein [Candidatus Kapaibacteriales bacterium]
MKKLGIINLLLFCLPFFLFSQWEKVKNIPPPYDKNYWLEMYFLPEDPNYGWVCGFEGRVLRTTDRGKTWSGTTILSANQLEHIQFPSKKVGYTSGIGVTGFGKIYKSTDGGATWFDITPPKAEDLWGHFFLDEDYGLVIGGGCLTPQKFFLTTDGGRSWIVSEYNVPNTGLTDLILYSKTGLGYATSSGWIWKTENGGRSWSLFSKSLGNDWQEDLWITGNTIIVPYSLECTGNGNSGGVRSSKDLGKSWKQFSTGSSMFGAFLLDSLRGWACGWNSSVYYTSNGGDSWELQNCGIQPGSSLDDFWFIDDTTGWVVGTGIYKFVGRKIITSEIEPTSTTACEGDTIILRAKNNTNFYHWSINQNTREIRITKSGEYELLAWDTECDSIIPAKITVNFYPKPKVELSVPKSTKICEGDTLRVSFTTNASSFYWNNGSTSDTIFVTQPGKYTIFVQNEFGCVDSASVDVTIAPNPKPKIQASKQTSICQGDSVILTLSNNFESIEWYEKRNPTQILASSPMLVVKNSGSFFAKTKTKDGCLNISDTVNIEIRLDSNALQIFSAGEKNTLHFDSVKIRNVKCLEIVLKNTSSNPLIIDYLFIKGNVSFSTLPSLFPLHFNPEESKIIPICYLPHKLGTELDTIVIFDRCWDQFIYLIGNATPEFYSGSSNCDVAIFGKTKTFVENAKYWDGQNIYLSSTNKLLVSLDGNEKLILFNLLGQIILTNENDGTGASVFELDLSHYPTGIYLMQITNPLNGSLRNIQIIFAR